MKKQKYSLCFNCYKFYYDTGVTICFASFPCKRLAEDYIEYYGEHWDFENSPIAYYVKKESVAKFTNF